MRRMLSALLAVLILLGPALPALAAGNCTVFSSFSPGQLLTAAALNANLTQAAVTNMTPACLDDLSANAGQMATATDPYPAGAESLATSLAGELERMRYVTNRLGGWLGGSWYKHTTEAQQPVFNYAANGNLESWDAGTAVAPTSWTLTGTNATVAREGTTFHLGAFAAALTRVGNDAALTQRIDTANPPVSYWRGRTVTFSAAVHATVADRARLQIDDGIGTTASTFHAGTSAFVVLSVTRTLDGGATKLEVQMRVDGGDTVAIFDRVSLTMGAITPAFIPSASANVSGVIGQSYQGMLLRSHPDADLSANQVQLLRAAEIVMQDGTRVADWPILTLDISTATSAGAGGVDVDADRDLASTWYEVQGIRNSSSGTRALLARKATKRSTDAGQSFTTVDNAQRALRIATSTATDKLAQGFRTPTVGFPGKIVWIDAELIRAGAVTGNIWFTIEADAAGVPSGTPLATSDKINAGRIPTTAGGTLLRATFRVPFTTADVTTSYHLVLQGDYTRSDTIFIAWRGVTAGGYSEGIAREFNGTTWTTASGVGDFIFKVYTERFAGAPVMPAGFDQRALLGFIYNDASSNLRKFSQWDRVMIGGGLDWQVTTASPTVPTLVDLSTALPPVPVEVHFSVGGSGAGTSFSFAPTDVLDALDTDTTTKAGAILGRAVSATTVEQTLVGSLVIDNEAVVLDSSAASDIYVRTIRF